MSPSSYGLCQVRSLHMLIAAAKRACGVCYVRTYISHNPLSRVHAAYHVPVPMVHRLSMTRDCALYLLCCLILMTSILMTCQVMAAPKVQERLKRAKNEYVILAGSSLFHYEWSELETVCTVGPRFSRENGVRGVRTRQRKGPLRGGASRPARPRRLEAGAARISP